MPSLTPWDQRAIAKSAALTSTLLVLAVLVTAVTDEGGVAWGERVSLTAPLSPVCAALAVALSLSGRDRRGEGRALEALGRSPFACGAGAAAGALAVGLVVAVLLLVDARLSVSAFFPTVHATGPYTFDGGVFTNVRTGWRVMADGSIALPPAGQPAPTMASQASAGAVLSAYARPCAALLTALASAGFVATVVVARPGHRGRAVLLLLATAGCSVFFLQAAAAGRVPVLVVPVPSTLLLLGAAWAIVRDAWQPTRATSTRPRAR